jgi:hypothetical protein
METLFRNIGENISLVDSNYLELFEETLKMHQIPFPTLKTLIPKVAFLERWQTGLQLPK